MNTVQKGFTLIELLIVIAILAILTAAVVVVLNPAQLLAQARDAQRLSDASSVVSAITLWLTTADSPTMAATSVRMTAGTSTHFQSGTATLNTATNVTGTGWVPVNLAQSTGGSPLGVLPVDPTNSTTYFYSYCQTATTTFEVDVVMESTKYLNKTSNDGGSTSAFYETGTNLAC